VLKEKLTVLLEEMTIINWKWREEWQRNDDDNVKKSYDYSILKHSIEEETKKQRNDDDHILLWRNVCLVNDDVNIIIRMKKVLKKPCENMKK